ncbi:MAG: aconitate hydratase [Lentisphaeria bacterium]|nr:aconitate hydratase [Lentisphaeria bacterium]
MARGTLVQKIIASHLVSGDPAKDTQLLIRIDQTLTQDATGTMAYLELEAMKTGKVATELSVSYVDHNMMQNGPENRNDHLYLQTVAAEKGVIFSPPGNGICHQLHLERFGKPGKTLIGSDSHTPTGGGIGMIAIGAGGLDVALAMAGQPFTIPTPKIVGVKLTGKLKPWVAAKDVILKLLSILTTKGNVGSIVEYFGPGVADLSVPQRATITNMGAELGVTTSVFPSDERTREFLRRQKREEDFTPLAADADAEYDRVVEIDLDALEPLAACPSSPDNIKSLRELAGKKVGQVLVGSCTNGGYRDLALVAAALKGRKVHPDVTFGIAPGSRPVLEMLCANGMLGDLVAAGARILEVGCGPCIGQGQSPADDTVTVRTFNRNFAGRSGTKGDQSYLVSPETAVVAAIAGEFVDPRDLGIDFPVIEEPEFYTSDDAHFQKGESGKGIIRKPTIGEPPANDPLPQDIDGVVVIKVGDKITTDHIMPAGVHLKLRSNIPAYSKVVFECFKENGKPGFAERAAAVRDAGKHGIIIGRDSYGQGSSREHAAICPMYLGIKVVAALAIERIHRANLINFGIVPLIFKNPADYEQIAEGDSLTFASLPSQLVVGGEVTGTLNKADGSKVEIRFTHPLSENDIRLVKAGGRLNC